ncbi:hypothetical protein TWF970_001197 [Orbilia oligospora]|uniref:Membrane-associated proteins in eicosanoid and glutathione metabolism n=1 Tax=Orbilia oligospora TaxID=2813651 RepID=A0A7C8VHQ6_ORBOL|nr:hypothetical protein TWF970_001197 [Orbilia oligospora]
MSTGTLGLRIGTPVTALALPIFTSYYSLLAYRVISTRVGSGVFVGDKSKAEAKGVQDTPDPLTIATRSHANFAENVPLALTITALAEINGADRNVLLGALGTLFLLRVGHVEFGLRRPAALGPGRIIGFLGTLGYLVGMSGYVAWLTKGYWGY